LTEVLRDPPPLLLDDVFSELDESRRKWLAEGVRTKGQTIVSSAEPTEVVGVDLVLEVKDGEVRVHE
ncbi:MAG: DNA replication and repair protein RecF, partial [Actinomycetota bacterium]|nr:DNA replication and repair protein RecF [Actinomycetota bacterium]